MVGPGDPLDAFDGGAFPALIANGRLLGFDGNEWRLLCAGPLGPRHPGRAALARWLDGKAPCRRLLDVGDVLFAEGDDGATAVFAGPVQRPVEPVVPRSGALADADARRLLRWLADTGVQCDDGLAWLSRPGGPEPSLAIMDRCGRIAVARSGADLSTLFDPVAEATASLEFQTLSALIDRFTPSPMARSPFGTSRATSSRATVGMAAPWSGTWSCGKAARCAPVSPHPSRRANPS